MKISVLGTGAMGSIYAARMANAGHDVWAIDTWDAHVAAINDHGLRVDGPNGTILSKSVTAAGDLSTIAECDLYIIATKASGVSHAAKSVAQHMPTTAVVLTIQNGLGAGDRIAQYVPSQNIQLGVAEGFGASMVGPGHAHHTSMKQIRLGVMAGGQSPALAKVHDVWKSAGFDAEIYEDIDQLIWEKLLCNVTLSGPCTVFGCNVADLRSHPDRWGIALGCMREAYAIGVKQGINFTFDDPVAYVTAFAERVGTAKPSMLQDFEAKRPSELDAINGAIPPLGLKQAIPTPYNDTITAILRRFEENFQRSV